MSLSPDGSPSRKWESQYKKNDEFNKFKEDTEKEIKKIKDILLAPHADAESSELGGKVAERYFHMAVRANENVAAFELKVKENEETINKLIIENHAKALTEINENTSRSLATLPGFMQRSTASATSPKTTTLKP